MTLEELEIGEAALIPFPNKFWCILILDKTKRIVIQHACGIVEEVNDFYCERIPESFFREVEGLYSYRDLPRSNFERIYSTARGE